jgi:hypothetical protein
MGTSFFLCYVLIILLGFANVGVGIFIAYVAYNTWFMVFSILPFLLGLAILYRSVYDMRRKVKEDNLCV